ncbi:dolichyl-phosphate-mannose-protein mannosyltransferase, partial [gut metagenome]
KTIYVDKFLRPGFMYYSGTAGIEMLPRTGAFADAIRNGEEKYILVRGLELRRLRKAQPASDNLHTIAEISDIYLLEQK